MRPELSRREDFDPVRADLLEDPYPFYERARLEEPVFFSQTLGMWVATRMSDVRDVMGDATLFSARDSVRTTMQFCPEAVAVFGTGVPRTTGTAVDSDPPEHTRIRKLLNRAFSAPRMRRFEPQIHEIVHDRIDALAPVGHAEVRSDIGYPIPLQVICRLCDIGDEDLEPFVRQHQAIEALNSPGLAPDRQVHCAQHLVDCELFVRQHIERKRAEPGEDVTSELIAGGGDEPFSESELVHQLLGVVVAATDTTDHLIGNALHRLLSEPSRWRDLVVDPSRIPAVIEEILRFDPPVVIFKRTAMADNELAGKKITEGDTIMVVLASANRDSKYFTNPNVFDLQRTNASAHMTFGHGIHFCVGAPLARIEGRVVLEVLASRLPSLRLVADQELRHLPLWLFRGFERLEVAWD